MLSKLRNIGVIAHIDAGKTTITERMLFYSGFTHRVGQVDSGTTNTDFDPEEQERGITIMSACVTFPWKDCQFNLIDTPGHVDFTAEVERSLRVLDGGVVVFSAREGVEAQSETVWRQADTHNVPRIAFVNKMDREGADFYSTVDEISERLGANSLVLTLPIGEGPPHFENGFSGIIDLVTQKKLTFSGKDGNKVEQSEVEEEMREDVEMWRSQMLESLSMYNDAMMELILEEKEVPAKMIHETIRTATLEHGLTPVFCGSALDGIGVQPVLDAVVEYLPSPLDMPPVEGDDPKKEGKKITRKPDPKEPFCGLVFKIQSDKHGDLHYVRVYSGTLKANSRVINLRSEKKENVPQLWKIQCDRREQIQSVEAGDIVGIIGLKHTVTGDTLSDTRAPLTLESITFPETVISMAIEAENTTERKKLATVLEMMGRQDPTFQWKESEETGQTIISGMGELHLEVIKHRLLREHQLDVRVHNPRVSYRETVTTQVEATGECKRTLGGESLFASVTIRVEPKKHDDTPVAVRTAMMGSDTFSEAYHSRLLEALRDRANGSGLFGFQLMDVLITLVNAEVLDNGSSEVALQMAAADALDKALSAGTPGILEPVMSLEVTAPEEYVGEIVGDLQQRRAIITRTHARGNVTVIDAEAPLANLFGYSSAMRSLSQGRATCSMEPLSYGAAPPEVIKGFV